MTQDYFVEQLKQRFQGKESFTKEDLFNFYHRWDPQLNESTFRWRIYNLKQKKIIRALSKSEFSLSYKPELSARDRQKDEGNILPRWSRIPSPEKRDLVNKMGHGIHAPFTR